MELKLYVGVVLGSTPGYNGRVLRVYFDEDGSTHDIDENDLSECIQLYKETFNGGVPMEEEDKKGNEGEDKGNEEEDKEKRRTGGMKRRNRLRKRF